MCLQVAKIFFICMHILTIPTSHNFPPNWEIKCCIEDEISRKKLQVELSVTSLKQRYFCADVISKKNQRWPCVVLDAKGRGSVMTRRCGVGGEGEPVCLPSLTTAPLASGYPKSLNSSVPQKPLHYSIDPPEVVNPPIIISFKQQQQSPLNITQRWTVVFKIRYLIIRVLFAKLVTFCCCYIKPFSSRAIKECLKQCDLK